MISCHRPSAVANSNSVTYWVVWCPGKKLGWSAKHNITLLYLFVRKILASDPSSCLGAESKPCCCSTPQSRSSIRVVQRQMRRLTRILHKYSKLASRTTIVIVEERSLRIRSPWISIAGTWILKHTLYCSPSKGGGESSLSTQSHLGWWCW